MLVNIKKRGMPKLYYGSKGGVYYKKKGKKVYVNRFGSDGFDREKFKKVLFENMLFWDDNPDKMDIAWTGYPLHGLLDIDAEIFKELYEVNKKVITIDSQGEFCDEEFGAMQRPYIKFAANRETVNKILNNKNSNICFYYYLNDNINKMPDEDVILTYDDNKPFSIFRKYKEKEEERTVFFDECNITNLYDCLLVYKNFCEEGSFLKLVKYLNSNSVGEKIDKKEYESKKNDKENKLGNLKNTILYIRWEYKLFMQRVEFLTQNNNFEKDDLIQEITKLITIHNKKLKELLNLGGEIPQIENPYGFYN